MRFKKTQQSPPQGGGFVFGCLGGTRVMCRLGHEIALDMAISQFAHTPKPHRGCTSAALVRRFASDGITYALTSLRRKWQHFSARYLTFPQKRRYAQMWGAGAGVSGALCVSPQCGVRAPRNEFFAIVGKKRA